MSLKAFLCIIIVVLAIRPINLASEDRDDDEPIKRIARFLIVAFFCYLVYVAFGFIP